MSRTAWIALAAAAVMALATARLSWPPAATRHESIVSATPPAAPVASIPPIRVHLGTKPQWRIRVDGPYQITRPGDWHILAQGAPLEASPAIATADGPRIAERQFEVDALELRVVKPGSLWVGETRYRGDLFLFVDDTSKLTAVNQLPLEEYLASVVNGEMPASFPDAARRAQAIAARTYALYHMKTAPAGQLYDVRRGAGSQVYGGMQFVDSSGRHMAVETSDSRRIVDETRGIVATYRGRLFCTFYGAVCGGHTMRGDALFPAAAPPLVGAPCEGCTDAPNFRWQAEFSWPEAHAKLMSYLADTGRAIAGVTSLESIPTDATSPVEFDVVGPAATQRISATQLRRHVLGSAKLPSDRFRVQLKDGQLHVEGQGWGHGVGMCQWGARGLALVGRTCPEIVEYYYPGCRLVGVR